MVAYMPGARLSYQAAEAVTLALAVVLAGILALIGYRRWIRSRVSPVERERARRSALMARGKMGDATLVEFREDLLFYSYSVRGVVYTASQDTAGLTEHMPSDLSPEGAAWVKYDPRNPDNSIVLYEGWNGLQSRKVG